MGNARDRDRDRDVDPPALRAGLTPVQRAKGRPEEVKNRDRARRTGEQPRIRSFGERVTERKIRGGGRSSRATAATPASCAAGERSPAVDRDFKEQHPTPSPFYASFLPS